MVFVFVLNSRLCPEEAKDVAELLNKRSAENSEDRTIDTIPEDETFLAKMCKLKSSVVTNLVVVFLFITVIRQVMMRTGGR